MTTNSAAFISSPEQQTQATISELSDTELLAVLGVALNHSAAENSDQEFSDTREFTPNVTHRYATLIHGTRLIFGRLSEN